MEDSESRPLDTSTFPLSYFLPHTPELFDKILGGLDWQSVKTLSDTNSQMGNYIRSEYEKDKPLGLALRNKQRQYKWVDNEYEKTTTRVKDDIFYDSGEYFLLAPF